MPRIKACDACFKKKIQCSLQTPGNPCSWCHHQGIPCTFEREQRSNTDLKFTTSDIKKLFERVAQLENEVSDLKSGTQAQQNNHNRSIEPLNAHRGTKRRHSSIQATSQSEHESLAQTEAVTQKHSVLIRKPLNSTCKLGCSWFYQGIAIFSDRGLEIIKAKTKCELHFGKLPLLFPSLSRDQTGLLTSIPTPPLANVFNPNSHRLVYDACRSITNGDYELPHEILDWVLFEEHTLELAYKDVDEDGFDRKPDILIAQAICLAILAVAKVSERTQETSNRDALARQAESLLQLAEGHETLYTAQVALLLQRYHLLCGNWPKVHSFHALACRIICELDGHVYQNDIVDGPINTGNTITKHEGLMIRTLFWVCYTLDKDMSLWAGRPPLLPGDLFNLHPRECGHIGPGKIDPNQLTRKIMHPTLNILGIAQLKLKIYECLYSSNSTESTDADYLLHVRELDILLEDWRVAIPSKIRPKLAVSSHPLPPFKERERAFSLRLQFEYLYMVIAIHAPVRRCAPYGMKSASVPEDLHCVFHSSTDLVLEASRSTLCIQRDYVQREVTLPQHILFYAATACISIFANILVHPDDNDSLVDAQLLHAAQTIMAQVPLHELTPYEERYKTQLVAFATELSTLSDSATAQSVI